MIDFKLTYHHFSERSILVQWPQKIDKIILDDIVMFKNHLKNLNINSILQINIAYNSILIIYNTTIDNVYDEFLRLKSYYLDRNEINRSTFKQWRIPVCYDDEFGIDLDEISKENKLSKLEIIRCHSDAIYTVFFIGFLPGFLYLSGLDNRICFPRKKQPRKQVKKGAVAIGNNQTGIYPNESPGGWQIVGNSPLNFFDPKSSKPCFAKSGDRIQFVPISKQEYYDIKREVNQQTFNIQSCIVND